MKKLIYVMSLILSISALQQCRNSDSLLEDQDNTISNSIYQKKGSDSTHYDGLYPDPPIKDGHDWRSAH